MEEIKENTIEDKAENSEKKTRGEIAEEYFLQGYNCTQSVFLAFADIYGFDKETAAKISASFGGGMGRMREVCGTVSGMFLVAGMETGATEGKDAEGKQRNYAMVQKLAAKFKERNGSIICRELLGLGADGKPVDTTITKPEERNEQYYKKRPCKNLVRMAAEIAAEEFGY